MSFCRWSCDNFKSDVYAYEGYMGYEIHVKKGESFIEEDWESFKNRMYALREEGYYIPPRVFDVFFDDPQEDTTRE